MKKINEHKTLGESGFWQKWISKLLFTIISVKVWGLIAGTFVSTYLLLTNYLNGAQWLTFNTTVWALIFGMKEIFRISESKDIAESENLKEQINSKVKITSIMNSSSNNDPSKTTFTADGKEIVGEEPDSEA